MAGIANEQAQVGGVTVGAQIGNPMESVTAGVQTGADWAMRNYQVQGQMAVIQQQAQQLQLENMKTRYAIGTTLYDRMQRIAKLPMGNAKNSEIDLLGQDMSHLGMELHPSAIALMKDKELSKGLGTVLNSLQSGDPTKQVQAMGSLPYFLSSDKILDMYTEQLKLGQATALKQAEMQHGTNLEGMRQAGEDTRQQKKLDQERQIFGVKTTGDIRTEVQKVGSDYQNFSGAYQKLQGFLKRPSGPGDDTIVNQFNQLQNNPTLRSYEAQMYVQGAPLIERARSIIGNWVKGTHLSPLQRKQIGAAADYLNNVNQKVVKQQMMPYFFQIQNLGTDTKLVFPPNVHKLLMTPDEQMPNLSPMPQQPAAGQTRQKKAPAAAAPQGPLSAAGQAVNPKTPVMLNPGQVAAGRALVQQYGPGPASAAIAQRMGLKALSPAMQRQLGIPVAGGQ